MKLGFIGFGGAAYGLAKGLNKEGGLLGVRFFDAAAAANEAGGLIRRRAAEVGATPMDTLDSLIEGCDVVISCVTGAVACEVAKEARKFLQPRHLYADVNTASPATKQAVFAAIRDSGASFVDVAMLGAVPAYLHRVPCLASGNGAPMFKELLSPLGMRITLVGEQPGQAAAIKMFRSIFMKGFLALLLETLSATHHYQVDSLVLDSLGASLTRHDFFETVRLQLAKGMVNAERMAHEMEEVVQTLEEMNLPATMASAAREKLAWCSRLGLPDILGKEMDAPLAEILDALVEQIRLSQ